MSFPYRRPAAAFCVAAAALSAQTVYRDPGGLYTVEAPANWKVSRDAQSEQVTFRDGAVSATLHVSRNPNWPKNVQQMQDEDEQEMRGQCPTFRMLQRGPTTIAGAPGAYFLTSCSDPRSPAVAEIAAALSADHTLILLDLISPKARYFEALPQLEAIRASIRLTGQPEGQGSAGPPSRRQILAKACAAEVFTRTECTVREFALNGEEPKADYLLFEAPHISDGVVYRDPQGHFSFTMPRSWQATPLGENGFRLDLGAARLFVGYRNRERPGDVVLDLEQGYRQPNAEPKPQGTLGLIQLLGNRLDVTSDQFPAVGPQGEAIETYIAAVARLGSPEACCAAVVGFLPEKEKSALEGLLLNVARAIRFGE